MFVLYPFALEPASPSPVRQKPLPMLPVSSGGQAGEIYFEDGAAQACQLAADLLRRALIAMTSSLSAFANQANLLFSQVAAALAFDRMARQAASFYGMGWSSGPYFPQQSWAAGLWPAPFQNPVWYSPAAIPAWPVNPWANPWSAFADAFTVWANIWTPAIAPRHPMSSASGGRPPFTTTLSIPGWSWSVTLG